VFDPIVAKLSNAISILTGSAELADFVALSHNSNYTHRHLPHAHINIIFTFLLDAHVQFSHASGALFSCTRTS
jgi:precorrin-6x reductase